MTDLGEGGIEGFPSANRDKEIVLPSPSPASPPDQEIQRIAALDA